MFGPIGLLIALIVLTIVLVAVFIVRPSFTAGTAGKILAFIALCALPGALHRSGNVHAHATL